MAEVNWSEVGNGVLDVLKTEFEPLLKEGVAEARERLALLSKEIAACWQKALSGDAFAEKDLEFLKAEMRLIVARYAVVSNAAARRAAAQWIEIAVKVGGALLKAVIL